MSIVGEIQRPLVRSIEEIRRWIMQEISRIQKPILDRKIDEMLKEAQVRKRVITSLFNGIGKGIGRPVKFRGTGQSLKKLLFK